MTGISAVDLSSAIDSIRSLGAGKRLAGVPKSLDALFSCPKKESKATPDQGPSTSCSGMDELESWARTAQAFQFSASQSEFSLSGNGFEARGLTESFQLEATFQQGDSTLQLRIEVERTTLAVAYGSARRNGGNGGLDDVFQKLLSDLPATPLTESSDSPSENGLTPSDGALRLASLLKKLTAPESGDSGVDRSASDRERLFDSLIPVVEQGLQDALDLLGPLPPETQDDLNALRQQTLDLVRSLGSSK